MNSPESLVSTSLNNECNFNMKKQKKYYFLSHLDIAKDVTKKIWRWSLIQARIQVWGNIILF